MWSIFGTASSLTLAVLALLRSRSGGFYDAQVYGMTARTHRIYATVSLLFAVVFFATLAFRANSAAIVVFGPFTLLAIFYLTSFLRGFSDDQE